MKRFFLITLILGLFIVSPTYALPPGGGAESFIDLDDVPSTYTGQTGKYIKVNVAETGLEFGVPPGGGDMLAATFDADANDAIDLNRGGTNAQLTDPNADRVLFWRDSAGVVTWLTMGNGLVISTTTLNLDLTPTAGSATLQYNDDALTVKYDATMFGEGANGLELDITPSAGNATLIVEEDALQVKYDAVVMTEGADGLTLDIAPSAGSATLVAEEDALQVKYDTTLTEGVNGLGVSNTLTNAHLSNSAAIAFSKLANLTSAHILVGSATNVPTDVAVSGDLTLANTGAFTIANNAVTGTKISLSGEATGDLMNYNAGTGNWEVLVAGTANYPLVSTGAGAVPGYSQLTATGIANNTITNTQIANNTIGTGQLAANLPFADGDLIDLSGITPTGAADEGLILPTWANVTPASDKPFLTYDPASNSLKVYEGGWVTIGVSGGSGAPTDATYLTVSLDGTLSAERTISAGLGIGASDGGVNAAYTLTFAPAELGNLTWGTGSAATQAWTFDGSGTTDPVLTAGDGYISVTTGELRESTRRVYSVGGTDVAVADGGTGKSTYTQYSIPYMSATTTFGEIAIGTAGYTLNVNGTTNGYTWTAPLTMDTITDGPTNYQKVAAADVNASGHIDRFYTLLGTGYITIAGPLAARAKTFSDGDATVMEQAVSQGGLIFGDSTPDSAGEIGYATGVISFYNGSAVVNLVSESVATGGLIFGDSTPDAAGEIAYNANGVQYYDTAARTLATLETAQTISGVKRIADNTNFSIGTDADWSMYYDETTSDNLVFSTAKIGATDTATAMFKIRVNSGAGTLTESQNVFEIMNNTTSLFKVDENGNVTTPGALTFGSLSGETYIELGANSGGRAPTASSYQIYFDGGTDLSFSLNGTEKTVARLQDAQTFTGAKSFTGGIYSGSDTVAASIRLYDGSSNYWTLTSPTMSSNYTLTLPVDDGTSGQYLYTDGSGNTAWGTPTATAAGATAGMVQYNATGTGGALAGDAGFVYTAATDTLTLGETGAAGKLVVTDGTNTATIQQGTQVAPAILTLPISTSTISTIDLQETISGIKTFSAAPIVSALNSSGTRSLNALNLGNGGTIYALDGSDTFRGLYINYVTNSTHSGSSNTMAMIDIAAMTGDAESNLYGLRIGNLTGTTGTAGEVERGISIGTGWDYGIYNSSLTYLGAATTFAGGSDTLTLTTGGSSNYAALSGTVTKLAATSIALGSSIFEPEAVANGSTVLRSGQTNTNTVKVQAYDTDGSYADLITGTAGTTPTLTLAAAGGITVSNATTFSNSVTLDDGSGDSPSITFTGGTGDETAVFQKLDTGFLNLTTVAGDGLNILVGNLKVGNGTPTQTQDGEDAYIESILEVDGAAYFDGGINVATATAISVAGTGYLAFGTDPGDSGAVRMSNNTAFSWETSTPGTDIFIALDSSDILQVGQNANAIYLGTSGTGNVTVTGDLTVTGAGIQIGATGVNISSDNDGAITFLGSSAGFDEDLYFNLDDTENTVTIGSSTGVTTLALADTITTITTPATTNPYIYFNETDGTDWYIGLDDTGNTLEFRTNVTVGNSVIMELNEDGTGLTIGDNGDDDITLTFNSNSNDGTVQWMEDEEEFRIASSGGESLYIDLDTGTTDEIGVNTGSSANNINLNAIAITTTGTIRGAINNIGSFGTPTTTNPYTLSAANGYGSFIYYGATGTINLPTVAAGMNVCVYNTGAFTVTIDPGSSDRIVREGTAQSDGVSMTLSSGSGNFVCFDADADGWNTVGAKGTLAQGS